jgi:hypothetical protein
MMFYILLALLAVVGIGATIRAVLSDGYRRIPTRS